LLSSRAAPAQDFSGLDANLGQLENLITDSIESMERQQRQLEDLKRNLSESGKLIESYESILSEREKSLADLRARLAELSETRGK
jgi:predicted  nucleic acid-binding Zn-ribbon protein